MSTDQMAGAAVVSGATVLAAFVALCVLRALFRRAGPLVVLAVRMAIFCATCWGLTAIGEPSRAVALMLGAAWLVHQVGE